MGRVAPNSPAVLAKDIVTPGYTLSESNPVSLLRLTETVNPQPHGKFAVDSLQEGIRVRALLLSCPTWAFPAHAALVSL